MFEFNGTRADDSDLGIYRVLRVFFPLLPGTEDRFLEMPGMDGAYDFGRDLQPREIGVQFVLKQDSPENLFKYARKIAAWLNVGEAKRFIYDYEPDKYYMARPQGIIDFDRLMNKIGIIEVNFIAPDPFAYALESKVADTFPAVNAGTASCPCIITATVAEQTDSLKIALQETGEYIELIPESDFTPGDIVTLDTAQRTATLNGADIRADVTILSTPGLLLPTGEFTLTANPASVELEVEYRERWV